jgi:hypothetical protein
MNAAYPMYEQNNLGCIGVDVSDHLVDDGKRCAHPT